MTPFPLLVAALLFTAEFRLAAANSVVAPCRSAFLFDSYNARQEVNIFSAISTETIGTWDLAPAEVELVISSATAGLGTNTDGTVTTICAADWIGPTPPFSLPYRSGAPNSGVTAPDRSTAGYDGYSGFAIIDTTTVVVKWASSPSCNLVLASRAAYLYATSQAAFKNANSTDWQIAAQAGQVYSMRDSSDWVHVIPAPTSVGISSAVYRLPGSGFALGLPKADCEVHLVLASSIRAGLPWYAWVFSTAVCLLCWSIQIGLALFSFNSPLHPASSATLLSFTIASYVSITCGALGLLLSAAVDQLAMRAMPLSPGSSFFLGLLCASAIVSGGALWRLHERRVAVSLILRLTEQTLCMAFCVAMWYKGFLVTGLFSLILLVVANAYYAHLLSTLVSLIPDELIVQPPLVMTVVFFAPVTIPIGPLLGLYGPLFVARQAGETSAHIVRVFDALVAVRALIATSVPQLVLACLAVVLHSPFVPAFFVLVAISLWANTLGIRRFARLQRNLGSNLCGAMSGMWTQVGQAIDDAIHTHKHTALSKEGSKAAASVVAHYSVERKRVIEQVGQSQKAITLARMFTDDTGQEFVIEERIPPQRRGTLAREIDEQVAEAYADERRQVAREAFKTLPSAYHSPPPRSQDEPQFDQLYPKVPVDVRQRPQPRSESVATYSTMDEEAPPVMGRAGEEAISRRQRALANRLASRRGASTAADVPIVPPSPRSVDFGDAIMEQGQSDGRMIRAPAPTPAAFRRQ